MFRTLIYYLIGMIRLIFSSGNKAILFIKTMNIYLQNMYIKQNGNQNNAWFQTSSNRDLPFFSKLGLGLRRNLIPSDWETVMMSWRKRTLVIQMSLWR